MKNHTHIYTNKNQKTKKNSKQNLEQSKDLEETHLTQFTQNHVPTPESLKDQNSGMEELKPTKKSTRAYFTTGLSSHAENSGNKQ